MTKGTQLAIRVTPKIYDYRDLRVAYVIPVDKLQEWIDLLSKEGIGSKQIVLEQMKELVKGEDKLV